MSISNIDTFEHDIRDEIKNKEASIGDIASAGGTVSNTSPETATSSSSKNKNLLIGIGVLVVLSIVGFGVLGYMYLVNKPITSEQAAQLLDEQSKAAQSSNRITVALTAISPTLQTAVGQYATNINTNAYGTVVGINNYTTVFANMIRSEKSIAKEMLAGKYGDTPMNPDPFVFADLTESNQSMRIVTVGPVSLVYAFVGEDSLVISNSVKGLLSLRGSLSK